MLTAIDLTNARADVLETLVNTVTVQRNTPSVSNEGYPTDSWSTVDTVFGRIDNISRMSGSDLIALSEKGKAYYQLTVEWDADIRDNDQVIIDGTTYELKQVNTAQDDRIVRRGIVVLVTP